MITVTTSRLFIRRIQPADWKGLKKVTRDFAVSPYACYDYPFPSSDAQLQLVTKVFSQTALFFSVIHRESEEMIGYICLHDDGASFDLGYCFHSDFHRQGYAFEGCQALMDAFARQFHVTVFTAGTAMKNTPSLTLLHKLGFRLQYTEQLAFHKDERGQDILFEGGRFIRLVPES